MNLKINKIFFAFTFFLSIDTAFANEYRDVKSIVKSCGAKINSCVQAGNFNFQLPENNVEGKLSVLTDGTNYIVQLSQEPDSDYPSYRIFIFRVADGVVVNVMSRWSWDAAEVQDVNRDGTYDILLFENPLGISDSRILKWPVLIDGTNFVKTFNLIESKNFIKEFVDRLKKSISVLESECLVGDQKCLSDLYRAKSQLEYLSSISRLK